MDTLDLIETFATVVRKGGFSAASRTLGQPLATVSRKVTALEVRLGIQLLVRTTRKVRLTDEGALYLEQALPLVSAMEEVEHNIRQSSKALSGELTITSPSPFGVQHMVPMISQFLNNNPDISIRHVFDNERLDYVGSGIDLGLRIGHLQDSGLHQIKLGNVRVITCASPAYLNQFGTPQKPDDLVEHRTVAYGPFGDRAQWNFRSPNSNENLVEIEPAYRVDSIDAIVQFARSGGGIGFFYSYQVAELVASGELKIVLTEFEVDARPVSFLYPYSSYLPRRTRAFIDFAVPILRKRLVELSQMIDT